MHTIFTTSADGSQVAYERHGAGPALLLLHGGGGSRQEWQAAGYIERLQDYFTVITLDLRGHGESAAPLDPAGYTSYKMGQDMLAVADACGMDHFALWGMSFGGKIGRYLAVQSERVDKIVLMGTLMGLGVAGKPRQDAIDFCAHWPPILQAQHDGALDIASLSQHDQEFLQGFNVPAILGWVRAMLDWPAVEPADFRCPALWLVGAEDKNAMQSVKEYEAVLPGSQVNLQVIAGLDHEQVFEAVEQVLPLMLRFMQG